MTTTTQPGRTRAFALSWLSYASYYLGRKGFSVVKVAIAREHGLATSTLALIDSVYLVAYASGQLPSGLATDRLGARRVLALGLFASAAACAAFGASNNAAAFAVCFALNGLAQSTGWPASTKVMAEWSEPHNRGRIMGLWGTCYQVGGIAATALAAWALARYGWRAAFQLPACWLAGMGGVVLLWLRERRVVSPSDAPQPTAADDRSELRAVLRLPALYSYGACYFCIKLIRYSLLFWLPYYLHTSGQFDEVSSGYLSTGFEVGGVVGSIVIGYRSDRTGRSRASIAAWSLLGLAVALFVYARTPLSSALWHFGALAAIGALLFGPDSLISGAAAQDLGGRRGAATAVGIVNGVGSVGAFLQGALTVGAQHAWGWNGLLLAFVGLSLLSALCLVPALRAGRAGSAWREEDARD